MFKISITTPKGEILSTDAEFLLVKSSSGQYAILKDHIPIVSSIDEGYVKIRSNGKETFVAIVGGIVEQSGNIATVIAQEAAVSDTLDDAYDKLEEIQKKLEEENYRKAVDFAISEKKLKENIKKAKAGEMM